MVKQLFWLWNSLAHPKEWSQNTEMADRNLYWCWGPLWKYVEHQIPQDRSRHHQPLEQFHIIDFYFIISQCDSLSLGNIMRQLCTTVVCYSNAQIFELGMVEMVGHVLFFSIWNVLCVHHSLCVVNHVFLILL